MIDNAITSLIQGVAGVGDKVSPGTETVNLTAGVPRVAYTLIDEQRRYSDDGNDNLTQVRYQLDTFADSLAEARAIGAKIQAPANAQAPATPGLDDYKGTVDGTRIERIWFDGGAVQSGIKIDGKEKTLSRYLFDLLVEYRD